MAAPPTSQRRIPKAGGRGAVPAAPDDPRPVSAPVGGLLRSVGRRLRIAWGFAWVQLLAPIVLVAALGLVIVGRVRPWGWTEPAAALAVTIAHQALQKL